MSAPLLSSSQMNLVRGIGERAMQVDVTIRQVESYEHDDDNPFGDDTVEHQTSSEAVTVKGWLRSAMGRAFDEDGQQIVTVQDFTLRVPFGTAITPRSLVTIDGSEYTVIEVAGEDTWAVWTECYIRRVS